MRLRFAPLIRVSTEKQEQQGESLRSQKHQILQAVGYLGGEVPAHCWKYSGQEHATPHQERKKFEMLLTDSGKNLFDAVIVCDASRWSRDNIRNKEGLSILRQKNIRFFIGTTEYDLFNPEQVFFLGMSAEIGEFQANQQAFKSLLNRIERAKRNIPTCGKLPFGRTFDRKSNEWGIVPEKKQQIEYAAKQYLDGESLAQVAKKLKMNHPNLAKLLRERCGSEWKIEFHNERFNVHETVTLEIPPLLPQKTIDAIHAKARANQTFTHGQTKNSYLFGRMIFCNQCGYALFGQVNHYGKRYYRHPRERGCSKFNSIPADPIEEATFRDIYELFGDTAKMEIAAKQAIPNQKEIDEIKSILRYNIRELDKIKNAKNNLLDKVEKGLLSDQDIKNRFEKHNERESLLLSENELLKSKLEDIPFEYSDELTAEIFLRTKEGYFRSDTHRNEMTFKEKRAVLQDIFGGFDKDGKRFGVYVERKNDGNWLYYLKGAFDLAQLLEIDTKFVKQNMHCKRDAHYRVGVHQRRRVRPAP